MAQDQYTLRVFSNLQRSMIEISLVKTSNGWRVQLPGHKAFKVFATGYDSDDAKTNARTGLYEVLEDQRVSYPASLPWYLEHLWEYSKDKKMLPEEIQDELNRLGDWISTCSKSAPQRSTSTSVVFKNLHVW